MAGELLVGTAVMVGLLIAVLYVSIRGRSWYSYTPQTAREDVGWTPRTQSEPATGLLSRPGTWIVAFFLITGVCVLGVFLFASGSSAAGTGVVLLGAVATLVVGYLVGGVYLVARQRGHSSAMALFESVTASGVVFLLLVVIQLVALG